jgi:hypothetical protein
LQATSLSSSTTLLQRELAKAFEWFKVDRAVGNASNRQSDVIEPID